MLEPETIYEDDYLLVLNKPAGWVVNDAITTTNQMTIQSWLRRNFQFPISNFQEFRSGIVHRLDKETSGILLVAKTEDAFRNIQAQFKSREVKKVYTALVHGKLEPKEGSINAPVGRLPWNRERFGILPGGRPAETSYKVDAYYLQLKSYYSLLSLFPATGRTHQIRIHLKYLGHPIVGDSFYAGRKTARADRVWCPRLFLHASQISFFHTKTKRVIRFKSELQNDLKHCLNGLQKL